MKIDVLVTDGSPVGVCPQCLWGDTYRIGLGGAEYALITMCEAWTRAGHEVRLYNSPHAVGDKIDQRPQTAFDPNESRDVVIAFRTPNVRIIPSKGLKVWWSCDQYTQGDYRIFAPVVDKIVCISPFHQQYFREIYSIEDTVSVDLPVRTDEIPRKMKIRNRFIFTSVPDRGLQNLHRMWSIIQQRIPDASLVITSDYRLWGASQLNEGHRARWVSYAGSGVRFLGALPRSDYLSELAQADFMLYPCIYDELFCIAVAEAQCAGVYTVTSDYGALGTTNMGTILSGDPNNPNADYMYIQHSIDVLSNADFDVMRLDLMNKATRRFSIENILKQWDEKVFKHG